MGICAFEQNRINKKEIDKHPKSDEIPGEKPIKNSLYYENNFPKKYKEILDKKKSEITFKEQKEEVIIEEQKKSGIIFEEKRNDNSVEDIVPNEIKNSDITDPSKRNNNDEKKILKLWEKTLKKHNKYRRMHSSDNLNLNTDLCKIAQSIAEKYSEMDIENMYMIPPKLYKDDIVGENIAIIDECDNLNFEDIVNKWYEEKKNYEFGSNKYIENTGHFTQLIWKETKEVGFGHKKSNNGKIYFIAIYYPAGNIFKQFKYNVLKDKMMM